MPWTVIVVAFGVVAQSPAASGGARVAPDDGEPSHELRVDDLDGGPKLLYASV